MTEVSQKNKERREYYKKNKDKFLAKIECDICNIWYTKANKSNHMKSKKHKAAQKGRENAIKEVKDLGNKLEKLNKFIQKINLKGIKL